MEKRLIVERWVAWVDWLFLLMDPHLQRQQKMFDFSFSSL